MQTPFGARLEQLAAVAPPLQAFAMPGREISFVELLARVSTCASWIRREGCQPHEVVGITVADDIAHMVASIALLSLGIPHICLPTYDPVAKRADLARRLGVRRVVLTEWRDALPNLQALLLTREHLEPAVRARPLTALLADPDAPALYYASSGATGEPKIFTITHRTLKWRAECIARSEQLRPLQPHRSVTVLPAEETMAKSRLVTFAYLGVTSVLTGNAPDSLSLQELCTTLGANSMELGVLQLSSLMLEQSDGRPLPATTMVLTAGSRVQAKLRQQFRERFGVPLWVHYGTREFGRISCTFPDGDDESVETVGRPMPWIELEVVDHDGNVVPPGQIGEIRVRAEHMTNGYIGDPVATSRHFRDGWFYPRDLVSLTPEGRLCLHGRADDMMNLNGIKIFPAEIERVLEEHPAVKAAAAFSRISHTHGDIPMAAVELHSPATASIDQLMTHARAHLGVRAPRKIIVVDELPRNSAGKFVKRDLAQLVAQGM